MRVPIFGRRQQGDAELQGQNHGARNGLDSILDKLEADLPASSPLQRDMFKAILAINRIIVQSPEVERIQDVLGILGATGGFSCVVAALDYYNNCGKQLHRDALVTATVEDGRIYYFGDLPNHVLLEHDASFLSLTFGMPETPPSAEDKDLVTEVLKHVAGSIGEPSFGVPRLPEDHMPSSLPIDYVKHFWPQVRSLLESCNVPISQRPATIGFAVQHIVPLADKYLDRETARRIVVEYAVPMAKLDPAEFG